MRALFIILFLATISFQTSAQDCSELRISKVDETIEEFCEGKGEDPSPPAASSDSQENPNQASDPTCQSSKQEAQKCCGHRASECLEGESLSLFRKIQTHPYVQLGAGLGIAATAFIGMSELCAGARDLMNLGNAVANSYSNNCASSLQACDSTCKDEIETTCSRWHSWKTTNGTSAGCLKQTPITCTCQDVKQIRSSLNRLLSKQQECSDLNQKPSQFANGGHQLFLSETMSEACRLQASGGKNGTDLQTYCVGPDCDKKTTDTECTDPNGCDDPEEPPTPPSGPPGGMFSAGSPIPQWSNKQTKKTDDTDTDSGLGGAGSDQRRRQRTSLTQSGKKIDLPGTANTSSLNGEEGTLSSELPGESGQTTSGRGFRDSTSSNNNNLQNSGQEEEEEESGIGSGGFKGYARGRKGKSKDPLKLGKEKLKKLAKKQEPKRKLTGLDHSDGGAHENIFERISKRYQSSCEKKRLICR